MEAKNPKSKQKANLNRITLNQPNADRVDGWLAHLRDQFPGIRIKRNELVNWLIAQTPNALADASTKSIGALHFDDIQYLLWARTKITAAREKGESLTLVEIMAKYPPGDSLSRPRRTPRKRAKDAFATPDSTPNHPVIHPGSD